MYYVINREIEPGKVSRWNRRLLLWLSVLALLVTVVGCGGGGGGGGGNGKPTTVIGRVLRAENNQPEPGTTLNISGQTATTAADGTFSFANVNASAKSATVTPPSPAKPRTLTLTLTAKSANNLGDIFTSDTGYTASASGIVVAPINGAQQPVGNATVTIAGAQVKSGTDGKFSIPNLPEGLGADPNAAIGIITASSFESKLIFTQFPLVTGSNDLGTLLLGAPISTTPPSLPYTITGTVTSGGKPAPNASVTLSTSGSNQGLGTVQTDASGNYFFWVVPGQYSVSAMVSGNTQSITVTLAALDQPVTAPTIAF